MIAFAVAGLCVLGALGLLVALSVIDLRVRLLPDRLVLPFALLGIIFHNVLTFQMIGPVDMLAGAALGGGILYAIRFVANRAYGRDTLGLGDVKLMLAAGLWLGVDGNLMALTLGAACGVVHGLGAAAHTTLAHGKPFRLSGLEIPAGPGFAVGIVLAALYKFAGILQVAG